MPCHTVNCTDDCPNTNWFSPSRNEFQTSENKLEKIFGSAIELFNVMKYLFLLEINIYS